MKLGVIMDPIAGINYKKDTTLALLLAAQQRSWQLFYMEMSDLSLVDSKPRATVQQLQVQADPENWFEFGTASEIALTDLDVILMRKDPPFDMEYVYATYLLDYAHTAGTLVINDPAALREVNEKLFINRFPQCIAPTMVSRDAERITAFIDEHKHIVLKPLYGMGGTSVFVVRAEDLNRNVIIETVTRNGSSYAMAQQYLPEISAGDKRILLLDGEPIAHALARIPAAGESRGNLAAGGTGAGVELSDRDKWICAEVGPTLRDMGLVFVGLDVIGDYLTEINVTSPTCVRELDSLYNLDIGGQLMDLIASKGST